MIIDIDWNSEQDVLNLFLQTRKQLKTLQKLNKKPGKNWTNKQKTKFRKEQEAKFRETTKELKPGYKLYTKILDREVSWPPTNSPHRDYYVYAHCDPEQPLVQTPRDMIAAQLGLSCRPFYVGKGRGDRYLQTSRNDTYKIKKNKILNSGNEIKIHLIKTDCQEHEALDFERKLINIFGLIGEDSNNYLVNLSKPKI